jgi:hypothetical protein
LGGFGGGYGWRGVGRGGFGGGGFGESTTTTETYQVGTLIVDLFDGKTKSLLWRGSASEDLSGNSNNNIKKDEGRVLHALHLRGSKAWPS